MQASVTRLSSLLFFWLDVVCELLGGLLPLHDQFWPMTLIGIGSLSIAGWLFRHRVY